MLPGVIRNFYIAGTLMFIGGWFIPDIPILGFQLAIGQILIWWGAAWIVTSTLMVIYAKKGKFKHRDRILNMIPWKGDETVLDVGTGRGLLYDRSRQTANDGEIDRHRLSRNTEDLSNNKMENTLNNAALEGVRDKIDIKSEDVRRMSFPDGTFDVILSNLCVHNLYKPNERTEACKEIARVLKKGGVALISDFRHTKDYAKEFEAQGLKTRLLGPYWKDTFPKLTVVEARKD